MAAEHDRAVRGRDFDTSDSVMGMIGTWEFRAGLVGSILTVTNQESEMIKIRIALALSLASAANAQVIEESFRVYPETGYVTGLFGSSVAIDGTLAVVGSPGASPFGSGSGDVYMFETTTGVQQLRLNTTRTTGDRFGASVAISQPLIAVGTPGWDGWLGDTPDLGGVPWFTTDGINWGVRSLSAGQSNDEFGSSLAIDNTAAVVGLGFTLAAPGKAYLLDLDGQGAIELVPSDPTNGNRFGERVALSDGLVLVGAPGAGFGAVYVFDAVTGQQLAKLVPEVDDPADASGFGLDVAMSQGVAVIGAFGAASNFLGSAFLFDLQNMQQIARLVPDAASPLGFGTRVGISGDLVIVGNLSGFPPSEPQSVYLFDVTTGAQIGELKQSDRDAADPFVFNDFAISLAISGTTAIVGATNHPGNAPTGSSGAAYIFNDLPRFTGGLFLCDVDGGPGFEEQIFRVDVDAGNVFDLVHPAVSANLPEIEYHDGALYAPSASTNTDLFVLGTNGSLMSTVSMTFPMGGNVITSLEFIGDVLYGGFTTEGGGGSPSSLVTIDTGTGVVTLVGAMGIAQPTGGLAFDGTTLFAVNAGGNASTLYTVHLATGAATAVGPVLDQMASPVTLTGLEFGTDGVLYGLGRNSSEGQLVAIDPATGAASFLSALSGIGGRSTAITSMFSSVVPAACPGDIADDFGTLGADGMVSFGDFLALLGLIGPCPGGTPGCTGDIADDFGTLNGGDGMVSFGDFLALLGLIGPCN